MANAKRWMSLGRNLFKLLGAHHVHSQHTANIDLAIRHCQPHSIRLLSSAYTRGHNNVRLQKLLDHYQDHSSVNLSGEELTDDDMNVIINEVLIAKQCKQLLLESNKLTAAGVTVLARGLSNNHSLNYLDLSSNRISDQGVATLAHVLAANNHTLKKLSLAGCGITDEGVQHLAQWIKVDRTLTQLDLCTNEISDVGVRSLVDTLTERNSTMEMLWLVANPSITDESVNELGRLVRECPSLRRLWLFKCGFSETGKRKLKQLKQMRENFRVYANDWRE